MHLRGYSYVAEVLLAYSLMEYRAINLIVEYVVVEEELGRAAVHR